MLWVGVLGVWWLGWEGGFTRRGWAVLGVLGVIWWLGMAWGLHGYRFDDAFITYRYGENVALGRGVVFNQGERLMGSTAPGHLLLSAWVYAWVGKAWMPSVMSLLGCLGWCLQSVAVYRLFRIVGEGYAVVLAMILAVGGAGSSAWVAMETHLVMAAGLWAAVMAVEQRWVTAAICASVAALLRPDAALWGALLGGWCLWRAPQRLMASAVVYAAIWGPWLGFAWWYFGSPLPQSAAAKFQRVGVWGYLFHELRHLASWSVGGVAVSCEVIVVVWGVCMWGIVWMGRRSRSLWILPLYGGLHLLAYLYLRPFTSHAWHLYPAVVVFVLCVWCGGFALWEAVVRVVWLRWGLVGVFVVGGAWYGTQTISSIQAYPTHYWLGARQEVYRDIVSYLREVGKKTDRIASVEVGTLAFYSDQPMHDWGGLITREKMNQPKNPYQWAVIDRLYLKKLGRGLFAQEVFRRNDFTAYLYNTQRAETFSERNTPPRLGRHPRSDLAQNFSESSTRPASSGRTSTRPSAPRISSAPSDTSVLLKKPDCSAYRGAWSAIPRVGGDRGCVWTLAGMPTLAGERDGRRWRARIAMPMDLLQQADGSVLVLEMEGHRIRRIDREGGVSRWVGGMRGFLDGVGERARFDGPTALVSDGAGGVYVADTGNKRIRRVSALGRVTTVAGGGRAATDGGSQRGAMDRGGKRGATDRGGQHEATDVAAEEARFVQPQGLWRSADGRVYIADAGAHRIRRLRTDGRVETWAGSGRAVVEDGGRMEAGFFGPVRIVGDQTGRLFVTDMLGDALRQIDPAGRVRTVLRFASGSRPFGLVWGEGWLYVSLFGSHQIVRWRVGKKQAEIVAGSARWGRSFLDGPLHQALFAHPAGLSWQASTRRLLTVEAENHCVRVLGVP